MMRSFGVRLRNGTEVILREPRKDDARQLMRFINQVIREPMSGLPLTSPMSLKSETAWLDDVLNHIRNKSLVMLIAEIDGRIVGNCSIQRRKWKEKHRGQIGIALTKGARGIGLGEVMMRSVISLARRRMHGLEIVDLIAFSYNARAIALYKKLGFVETGRLPRAVKEIDGYHDDIIMFLDLDGYDSKNVSV